MPPIIKDRENTWRDDLRRVVHNWEPKSRRSMIRAVMAENLLAERLGWIPMADEKRGYGYCKFHKRITGYQDALCFVSTAQTGEEAKNSDLGRIWRILYRCWNDENEVVSIVRSYYPCLEDALRGTSEIDMEP
jgi:hypothetical protein